MQRPLQILHLNSNLHLLGRKWLRIRDIACHPHKCYNKVRKVSMCKSNQGIALFVRFSDHKRHLYVHIGALYMLYSYLPMSLMFHTSPRKVGTHLRSQRGTGHLGIRFLEFTPHQSEVSPGRILYSWFCFHRNMSGILHGNSHRLGLRNTYHLLIHRTHLELQR